MKAFDFSHLLNKPKNKGYDFNRITREMNDHRPSPYQIMAKSLFFLQINVSAVLSYLGIYIPTSAKDVAGQNDNDTRYLLFGVNTKTSTGYPLSIARFIKYLKNSHNWKEPAESDNEMLDANIPGYKSYEGKSNYRYNGQLSGADIATELLSPDKGLFFIFLDLSNQPTKAKQFGYKYYWRIYYTKQKYYETSNKEKKVQKCTLNYKGMPVENMSETECVNIATEYIKVKDEIDAMYTPYNLELFELTWKYRNKHSNYILDKEEQDELDAADKQLQIKHGLTSEKYINKENRAKELKKQMYNALPDTVYEKINELKNNRKYSLLNLFITTWAPHYEYIYKGYPVNKWVIQKKK